MRATTILPLLLAVPLTMAFAAGGGDATEDPRLPSAHAAATLARDDAARDGWDTEVFNSRTGDQLHALTDPFEDGRQVTADDLAAIAVEDVVVGRLRPSRVAPAYTDRGLVVVRGEPGGEAGRGLAVLAGEWNRLVAPMLNGGNLHAKFKLVRIEPRPDGTVLTRAYLELAGNAPEGARQVFGTWVATWDPGDATRPPRLLEVGLEDYEEAVSALGPMFTDVTGAVFAGEADLFREQFGRSLNHWWGRLDSGIGVDANGYHGIAVADVDGDGLEDLYVTQSGGLPNRLLLRNADGTVRDASAESGVDLLDRTRGALFADLDDDGDPDLVLALGPAIVVLENAGDAKFRPVWAADRARNAFGIAAADHDGDRDLDLYVTRYYPDSGVVAGLPLAVPYHDAENGGSNVLFRNDGEFRFTDVTAEVGLDANNTRFSFSAAWADYDDDGDQDLYVVNDFGRNNLYRNDGGRFVDVARRAGVEDVSAGMSVAWGDHDGDGLLDLYVSNMFSSAGNRIAYQPAFRPGEDEDTLTEYRRHARGNSLFRNLGDGTFEDVSEDAGVTYGRWAYGSTFVDVNADGRDDVLVANGYLTNEDSGDL